MIPQRVKMTGFLSYKDEQEVRFDGAPLWMLAGTNGSGKSSIFDGVTYALFGHHRGGSQNAAELINKDSNALAVEFDFYQDGSLYRVKRTIRRNAKGVTSGTQQIFYNPSGTPGDWEPVPDTGKKVDFDKWVHDKIGLNYETFTSSVLLLQGKAEKLLDSKPSGRAEVLASIVDLERYQRLYEKANAKKLDYKSRLEALGHQTSAVPEVGDLEYAAAVIAIDEADDARRQAQAQIDTLMNLEAQARRWADTRARWEAAKAKLAHAESLLGEAVKIEQAFARLQELREVLPAVHTVLSMKGAHAESLKKSELFRKQQEDANDRKARAEHAQEQGKKKRAALQKQLADDEAKLARTNARLRELSALLEKVRLAEEQESELRRLDDELGRLPADPEAKVQAAQAELDRLTELTRVLPILERFGVERHDLAAARRAEQTAAQEQAKTRAEGEKLKAQFDKADAEHQHAAQARQAADGQVAVSKAMADRAAEAAAEFATLAGEKSCRSCGQPLTPQHFAEEKRKRDDELRAAEAQHRAAVDARDAAADRERKLAAAVAALREQLALRREEYKDRAAEVKQAQADIKRLADSLSLRYAEMPDPYRGRIAPQTPPDWTLTTYPERDALVALRREAQPDGVKRTLADARQVLAKWQQLRAKAESARQTLTRLRQGLPSADLAATREEHRALQAEETTLINAIRGAKNALLTADTEVDKLGREAHAAGQSLTSLAGQLHTEEVSRRHCQDAIDRARKNLPPAWLQAVADAGMADHMRWSGELDELTAAGTEAKFKQLDQARGGLAALRQDIADRDAEAAAFPAEARRPPDEVRLLLAGAKQEFEARDKELHDARRKKAVFDGHREQRAKLGEQYKQADAAHARYKVLAELLGRDRLQRHLVRRAERQIVDYANAVLDRLSGGQLFLRLVGGDDGGADKALDLECANRVTGGGPINVAFLSGSQRFRVAVSLALAIGQYASKQHRPIESVIIDEGFGCLDRQGRQVMIQELQNLRGHLHCILLVSHQEEFADAFPDGYRFELHNGATRVSRFQR